MAVARILFLAHRLPYPPNKGDKVRSYHLLRHLAERHQVHLGTFVDDPDDLQHLPTVQRWCASVHAEQLHPRLARLASLRGLATGEALTEVYYRSPRLARWVAQTVARERIDATVVFSSSMAQYAQAHPAVPMLVDFVDVDSAKWADYAHQHPWPLSWLYAREGRMLLACERRVAAQGRRSFFATEKEAALFRSLAPEVAESVEGMDNGVDAEYFAPEPGRASPFATNEVPLVFTGAMDYWPNVDAVSWFAAAVLPQLRAVHPQLRLHIVGRSPTPAVLALAGDAVVVTGTVPDVRPYLQHAAAVVAPLRLARGIQNKILEAMAMGRPVVAAETCVSAMRVVPGQDVVPAREAADYVRELLALLADAPRASALGEAGRRCVVQGYAWPAHLQTLERHLQHTLKAQASLPLAAMAPNPAGARA
ncbi:TIGR03087 family PEP-CTERM/XrtA system glycosyltransferase [Rubrivivax rivuli]|nr:TIGR03087 family PEP-CTERM/XrtA system glycosyltransferase [Rubrivivax rivuli]